MKIACIEDEKVQRDYVESLCLSWGEQTGSHITVTKYENAEEFLFKHDSFPYDLLLVDISMKGMNGVDLARTVRNRDEIIDIAFITGDREYAIDGYEVGAIRYLVKPVTYEKLSAVLDIVSEKIDSGAGFTTPAIIIEHDCAKRIIPLRSIVYIEASGHYSDMHVSDGNVYSLKENFTDLVKRSECILSHRSYAVNISYVESIKKNCVILKNGEEIPISRGCFSKINEAFLVKYKPEILWE